MSDEKKRRDYDTYGFDGPKMGGFSAHHFDFGEADDLFKNFFRSSGFDNEDDEMFFGPFFSKRQSGKSGKSGGSGRGFGMGFESMFNDDFFKGFGGMGGGMGGGGFSSFSSHSSAFGNGPHLSKSVSTTTKTVNGKTVTTKKTTITNPDGSK